MTINPNYSLMNNPFIIFRSVGTASAALALLCLCAVSCSSDEQTAVAAGGPKPMVLTVAADDYGSSTRGTPSEDLYESLGLYAHTYTDVNAWENSAGTAPDFMVNEEVQNAGTYWLTVNAFDVLPSDRYLRFYAYYPYGLSNSVLSVTDENYANGPRLTYTVPKTFEDQKDLLAGSCFDTNGHIKVFSTNTQNSDSPENVQLTMSHILTAVRFQVGECKEAGRIKQLSLTCILGTNTYSLARDVDDTKFAGWSNKTKDNNSEDYTNFTFVLDRPITLTQRDGNNDVVMQPVTDDSQWLLMLPHTLSEDTWLNVTYYCGGSNHEMSVKLEDYKWLPGKKVTYTLNINSLQRLTVNSTVEAWNTGLTFLDGQPTNATSLDVESVVDDWTTTDKDVNSDDPR